MGVDVQDTLADYPVITGACRCRADDSLVFACSDAESASDAKLIVRSLRTGIWTTDSPPLQSDEGIEALSSYGDLVAYVSGGVVYQQHPTSFTDGASSVIVTQWKTHPIYPFEIGGNGKIFDLLVSGEYRSAGTLALRISYDDGVTFTDYDSFDLSGTEGSTIHRKWSIHQSDITSVVVELTYTPSSAGEGFIVNSLTFLVDPAQGLKDLNPGEMA